MNRHDGAPAPGGATPPAGAGQQPASSADHRNAAPHPGGTTPHRSSERQLADAAQLTGAATARRAVPLLRDVTLRDGLQLTGKVLPTEHKVEIVRRLLGLGVPELEIGSLARPDLVPPMANSLEVVAALSPEELRRCWLWVATPRHVEKAAAAGARNFQYCFSVSDAHNRANIGRATEDSVAAMPAAVELARAVGGRIQLCLATAFTCPFDGPVDPERVLAIAADPRTAGADDVVLADTLGQAHPGQVAALVAAVRARNPQRRIVFHGHDTWGLGVANSLAAAAAGADVVDGSLGGLGGCPFAPGASGNTSSEDLLFATRPDWFTPAVLGELVRMSEALLTELGEPNRSRTVEGARSKAQAFEWVIRG
ncbi:hydroxymethylglutaryl-CoA lyase [Nocardia otitidiscaviarum]|uniref:hydroxymethylglutaryl-CoA lyase n=1 Tax=Nocardia otitidiscaviarum TaxID=1823 RepID=UPI001E306791|nr:hydroxymethylglutaryl-CoA lyase [Nocardia otitidiscaviarum]